MALGLVGRSVSAVAACGGDDDSGADGVSAEAKPYVEALEKSMKEDDSGGMTLSDAQASCLAPKFINTIGVDTLKAKGVTPEDMGSESDTDLTDLGLSEAQGGELYDAFGACKIDVRALFISGIGNDSELSADDKKCLEDNFDDALLKQVMVITLTKGEDALQSNQDVMGKVLGVFSSARGGAPVDSRLAASCSPASSSPPPAAASRPANSVDARCGCDIAWGSRSTTWAPGGGAHLVVRASARPRATTAAAQRSV
jgi:hypothetical protein